jgi:hypothetical protein
MEQTEKLKISSGFIVIKFLFVGFLGILFLLLTDYKRTETNVVVEYVFIIILLSLLLYYLFTRPDIYYDSENLYITKGADLNIQIPFENIQSIYFSVIGFGQGSYSYKIKYLDTENKIASIRLFPSFFSNPVSKFISCVEKQNPKVKIRNGSFGINELFDK